MNLRAAEIRFQFDPAELQIQQEDIRPGEIWNDKASVIANVDEASGTVTAFVFSLQPIDSSDGNLLDIQVQSTSNSSCLTSPNIDLQAVRLNEGAIELETAPVAGPDPTDQFVAPVPASENPQPRKRDEGFIGPLRAEHVDMVMYRFEHNTLRPPIL
ncbi:cohesin domain-containing protein [Rhodopirellula sp. ICT_H3.1]|uniref:Cohesin domain-containing protein n=1 Tax=Aporhodopirellula aestuarii TaxID=2950107 RepID=A0ABT0U005_9BACT|nr:cohesin domain-containing protein [Aporhodopirellula aestuarii]